MNHRMENSTQTPGLASCQNLQKKNHELEGVQAEKEGRNWKTVHAGNPDKMKLPIFKKKKSVVMWEICSFSGLTSFRNLCFVNFWLN